MGTAERKGFNPWLICVWLVDEILNRDLHLAKHPL